MPASVRRVTRAAGELSPLLVASVWIVHGLFNKLLGASPRHLQIIQSTPGLAGAAGERALVAIGIAEVVLAFWVLSGRRPRLCAATQSCALIGMNAVELTYGSHLLLWPAGLIPLNLAFLALAWTAAASGPRVGLSARLRRHPLAIRAHFEECVTLTYAVPAAVLRPLLPPGLELETLRGYGFVAVALVQTRSLRPAFLPRPLGQRFFLAGYRVFARFHLPSGRTARGLRILRSDADRALMVRGGNLMTHYDYHRCDVQIEGCDERRSISVRTVDRAGDLDLSMMRSADPALPPGSPFESWKEARRFAGPLPFTFDYEAETHAIIAIEAIRQHWRPAPIAVDVRRIAFLDQPAFAGATPILAAAFQVNDIDYRWNRGRRYGLDASLSEAIA